MSNVPVVIDHSSRAHSSVVGGSTAARVLACPGSVKLCAQYPNRETEFAAEGSALHEAIDFILSGNTKKDTDVIGLKFNGYVITQEMFDEALTPALEFIDELDRELRGGLEFFNEQRVRFPGIEDAFGTVDIVGGSKDRSIVLDWKFGRGVAVDADENAQLQYYAYAALHTDGTKRFFDDTKPVELIIVQPRTKDGEPVTRWLTTVRQLQVFAVRLRKAVEEALGPNPSFAMGKHCKFCNAKAGCDLYNNRAQEVLGLSSEEIVARLSELLPFADRMIELGQEIKNLAHEQLEKGLAIEGFKLVNKRVTRSWTDEERAAKFLARSGVPAAERTVKSLISVAVAEKALKKLSVALPEGLVDKKSSGTTLAPVSDPRPAVMTGAKALEDLARRLGARS